ncbi:MAG TPA: LytTR family DNA-binding domain-containing protein [Sediminibacterium sp.]|nr:LytTR family DNA-binding domain-containing protein [Sediminibacterium sp.]
MIKILILEDEIPAKKKLKRFLDALETPIEIVAEIDTVTEGVSFLKKNPVDLIFSDIELLDGNSFEIYNQVSISCPIIFTTAYDQFWMDAFEINGIDYLLKPFSQERFQKSFDKFLMFRNLSNDKHSELVNLTKIIEEKFATKSYKKRFSVRSKQGIYFLDTDKICYFGASYGVVFAYDTESKRHLLTESTLKEIEELLNPLDFFRLNRSEIVNRQHIEKIHYYTKNSMAVKLKGWQQHLLTSQNNTAQFRIWVKQ